MIPSDGNDLERDVAARQVRMFAMFVGPGLTVTRAALAAASCIPESTLKGWAGGAAMPVHGILRLRKFLPPAAINMITEPGGANLVDANPEDADWLELGAVAAGLAAEVCEASPDGIDHREDARLRVKTRELIAKAQHMVGDG